MSDDSLLFHRMAARVAQRLPHTGLGRAILVTSARPREGKSYVAAALACALSTQTEASIALVDCTGTAAGMAAANPPVTWSDLVATGASLAPQSGKAPGGQLVGIPYGGGDASTLFNSAGVARALVLLRNRFPIVVLDGPVLADCSVLASISDGSILVINAERTRREIVKGSLQANPAVSAKMLGAVLNEIPRYVPRWIYRRAL